MTIEFLLIYILLIHFLADFGLQTHEQAINKSTDNKYLFYHVSVYSLIWFIAVLPMDFVFALQFTTVTFIFHYLTDFITSRIGKKFWDKKDMHNGFVVVGFDQLLHYIQLWLTFKYFIY